MPAVSGGSRRAKTTEEAIAIPQRQYGSSTLPLLNSQPWADSRVYICLLGGSMPCGVQRSAAGLACTMSSSIFVCIERKSRRDTMPAYDRFSVCEAEATRDHRQ
jgi:hypothetical protein